MNINIQTLDFNAKEELNEFVKEKVARLGRYLDNIISYEITLRIDKSETNDNKIADIRLVVPGNDLLASSRAASFEKATAQAIEALERQIEKRKTKEGY
jgi:ribosomal subunit interface protein